MRLFLAIDLPEKAKTALGNQIEPIQKEYPVFNWVNPRNYHLTVHFFGETSKAPEIIEKAKNILYDQEPFHLYAMNLDFFLNHNITIYAGFRRERSLEELITKTRGAFEQEFQETKTFIPHITLARCKIPSKQQYFHLMKKIQRLDVNIEFPVREVVLFESIISEKKPVYRVIKKISLADRI